MHFHYVPYRSGQCTHARRTRLLSLCSAVCTVGLLCLLAGAVIYTQLLGALAALPAGNAAGSGLNSGSSPASTSVTEHQMIAKSIPVAPSAFRAAWIATVTNIDWPARAGLSPEQQQQDFRQLLDVAQECHLNAVVVQVRPTADAFYPSQYAPWSRYLTGVQGRSPGYDPLAFMVQETHRRHMQFHAWFNPYRVSLHDDLTQLAATNPAREHPDWVIHYGGRLYFDPGLPQVRALVVQSILEVVQRYAVDGVQLDDYFYPYPVQGQSFPDAATYRRYDAAQNNALADWRRANVNQLIEALHQGIKRIRPSVQFGVSPFGVWRNQSADPTGSATHASITDYDTLYADTRTWIKRRWIDYIAPQLYWSRGNAQASYAVLLPWWVKEVSGSGVKLYIGQAAYNLDTWNDPQELRQQLILNQQYPVVAGTIFFSMKDLLSHLALFRGLWSMK